jgi:hypothetical protein
VRRRRRRPTLQLALAPHRFPLASPASTSATFAASMRFSAFAEAYGGAASLRLVRFTCSYLLETLTGCTGVCSCPDHPLPSISAALCQLRPPLTRLATGTPASANWASFAHHWSSVALPTLSGARKMHQSRLYRSLRNSASTPRPAPTRAACRLASSAMRQASEPRHSSLEVGMACSAPVQAALHLLLAAHFMLIRGLRALRHSGTRGEDPDYLAGSFVARRVPHASHRLH